MGSTDPRRQESEDEAEPTRCYTTQLQNGLLFLQLLLFNYTEVTLAILLKLYLYELNVII